MSSAVLAYLSNLSKATAQNPGRVSNKEWALLATVEQFTSQIWHDRNRYDDRIKELEEKVAALRNELAELKK